MTPKLLILVGTSGGKPATGSPYQDCVAVQRKTWVNEAKNAGVPVIFCYGTGSINNGVAYCESSLVVDVPSTYEAMTERGAATFRSILDKGYEFDYVLAVTAHMHVNVPVLLQLMTNKPKQGYYAGRLGTRGKHSFVSGACPILSRDVVCKVASMNLQDCAHAKSMAETHYSDVAVSIWLRHLGVSYTELDYPWTKLCPHTGHNVPITSPEMLALNSKLHVNYACDYQSSTLEACYAAELDNR